MNSERINHIETLLTLLVSLIQQQVKQRITFGIVTQKELLVLLDISPNTLKSWRKKACHDLPPQLKVLELYIINYQMYLIFWKTR